MKHLKPLLLIIGVMMFANGPVAAREYDLHQAVLDNDLQLVQRLLRKGAAINNIGSRKYGYGSALHLAVREGHVEIAKLLLDRGAEVDVLDPDDFTPLHNAAWNGNLDMTELLLAAGADINASTYDGDTPLSLAQNNDQMQVAEFIQARLQPSTTGDTKVESTSVSDSDVIDISGTYTNTELTYPSLMPRRFHSRFFGDGSNLKITIKQSGNAIAGVISGENPGEFKGVINGREITIESTMNSAHNTFISGKGTWRVSNDGDALTGSYRLDVTSFGNVMGSWNFGDVLGNWNFRKIEAEPAQVIDISGTYISETTVNTTSSSQAITTKNFIKSKNRKKITLEQTGNAISSVESPGNQEINGTREGNTIHYYINLGNQINGSWEISADGTEMAGKWRMDGAGGASGEWNLKRLQ